VLASATNMMVAVIESSPAHVDIKTRSPLNIAKLSSVFCGTIIVAELAVSVEIAIKSTIQLVAVSVNFISTFSPPFLLNLSTFEFIAPVDKIANDF